MAKAVPLDGVKNLDAVSNQKLGSGKSLDGVSNQKLGSGKSLDGVSNQKLGSGKSLGTKLHTWLSRRSSILGSVLHKQLNFSSTFTPLLQPLSFNPSPSTPLLQPLYFPSRVVTLYQWWLGGHCWSLFTTARCL